MAKIEFLGRLSDQCGKSQDVRLPRYVTDIAALRLWLNNRYDGEPLSSPSIRAIVNGKVTTDAQLISDQDTIAFFPPVGGG